MCGVQCAAKPAYYTNQRLRIDCRMHMHALPWPWPWPLPAVGPTAPLPSLPSLPSLSLPVPVAARPARQPCPVQSSPPSPSPSPPRPRALQTEPRRHARRRSISRPAPGRQPPIDSPRRPFFCWLQKQREKLHTPHGRSGVLPRVRSAAFFLNQSINPAINQSITHSLLVARSYYGYFFFAALGGCMGVPVTKSVRESV